MAAKISKLKPGGRRQLNAIYDSNRRVVTDPKEIAKALKQHWERTFKKEPIDEQVLENWLRELRAQPDFQPVEQEERRWRLKRKDVVWAIGCAKRSAPGPDGLSADHWRALGRLATDTLYEAAKDLENETAQSSIRKADEHTQTGENDFNLGILCCIPKGEGEADELHGRVHDPSQTRPLSLVDVSNRIMAAA